MMFKGTILGLVAVVVSCYGQPEAPEKCCFDENQFETYYGGNVAFVQEGTPIAMSTVQKMAIDVTGQRIGLNGSHYFYKGETLMFQTIQLFKELKQYTIINKTCTVQPLTKEGGPKKCIPDALGLRSNLFLGYINPDRAWSQDTERSMMPPCTYLVNYDAKFNGYLDIGKNELLTESWGFNGSIQGLQGNIYTSVSSKTCAALGVNFNGVVQSGGKPLPISLNGGFYNMSSGIKNPQKWFTVPSFCPKNVTDTQFGRENLDFKHTVADILVKSATQAFSFS